MKTFLLSGFIAVMLFSNRTSLPAPAGNNQRASHGLFDTDDVLNIVLTGNIRDLLNDRTGEEPKSFPIVFKYKDQAAVEDSFSIAVKTRGHFRRIKSNCDFPPLLLDFKKTSIPPSSIFAGLPQLKLEVPCRGDEFMVREWLVYKLYNLLTPLSFRARLVKATLQDAQHQKTTYLFYGILLENDKQMASRNDMILVKRKMKPQQTVKDNFLKMAMFEYLIGNTDWSVEYLQNINLLAHDSLSAPIAIPHDFDLSGIVNCPYAMPPEELLMNSVRERRYRGYCTGDMKAFDDAIAFYNKKKKDIYNLYTNCALLEAKYLKSTLKYLDDFYATINNQKTFAKEFGYPCDKDGTGNVIVKGLKQ
jgi:hypothetical protein